MINSVELSDSAVVSDAPIETDLTGDTDSDIATQEEDQDVGTTVTPENKT